MINPEIKFDFRQLQFALIGFCSDISRKVKAICGVDLPVYYSQTGDISYLIREKFIETKTNDIVLKTPRLVLNIEDIQYLTDQNTNQFNKVQYSYENRVYQAVVRRIATTVMINTDFVSPNFIRALENFEVMTTITSRENVFTYNCMGRTFESSYAIQGPSIEKPQLDTGSGTRNVSVKMPFDLQVQLITPRIESIQYMGDVEKIGVEYGLIIHDSEDDITENIKFMYKDLIDESENFDKGIIDYTNNK